MEKDQSEQLTGVMSKLQEGKYGDVRTQLIDSLNTAASQYLIKELSTDNASIARTIQQRLKNRPKEKVLSLVSYLQGFTFDTHVGWGGDKSAIFALENDVKKSVHIALCKLAQISES